VRYVRILLRHKAAAGQVWSITIRDRAGRPLQSIASEQLAQTEGFWTERLPTNSLTIDVESPARDMTVAETVAYVAVLKSARNPYYSIQGTSANWSDVYGSSSIPTWIRKIGESIGMLVSSEGDPINGTKLWTCTGFVVENKPAVLFVTNEHCGGSGTNVADRWTDAICRNTVVDFSWDGDAISRDYVCDRIMARAPEDDLTIIRLQPLRLGAPPAALTLRPMPMHQEEIFILHHPAAEPKKISQNCTALMDGLSQISTVNPAKDFAHRCDTEGGSSGAPILDANGTVIGVHHRGFEKTSDNRCDGFNKAVQSRKLLELLARVPR
jgi:hypothetical protein